MARRHTLAIGALDLTSHLEHATFELKALSSEHETDWGNPDPELAVVHSLLSDGDMVEYVRSGNRAGKIGVSIVASDSAALADAEQLLMAELYRRNTLTWIPPDEYGPASVFDVVTSSLEFKFDDQNENRLVRRFVVSLSLFPFPRSAVEAVVAASGSGVTPGAPPTEVLVTDANATTGFVAPLTGTSVTMYGTAAVKVNPASSGYAGLGYQFGSMQDFSATPLLVVDVHQNLTTTKAPKAYLYNHTNTWNNPSPLSLVSSFPSPLGGSWRRYVYNGGAAAGAVRRIYITSQCTRNHNHSVDALRCTRIGWTDGQTSYTGTTRQLHRAMDIRGSARTQASLQLSHTSSNLGEVLLWSGPAGNCVPLRSGRVSGGTVTADATMVSGAYEDIGVADFVTEIPAALLREGSYALLMRARDSITGPNVLTITAQTVIGGVDVGAPITVTLTNVTFASMGIRSVDTLPLPPTVTTSSEAMLRLTIGAADPLDLDEAWIANVTDGELTFVNVPAKNLWADAPDLDDPRPRLWIGDAADKSDAYNVTASAQSWGNHDFDPGEWVAFTVTAGAENAALTGRYPIRWHTHAAE